MSGHNWKPGDVAMVMCSDGRSRRALCANRLGAPVWQFSDGKLRDISNSLARPLVVIDPEDREQVKRLDDLLWATNTAGEATNDLQAALREFAAPTPPKPDEPQGLGAVVEDVEGEKWVRAGVRINDKGDDWRCVGGHHVGYWSQWSNLAAVRVLSEGVQ